MSPEDYSLACHGVSAVVEAVRHVENDRGVVGQEVVANLIKNLGREREREREREKASAKRGARGERTLNGGYDVEYESRLSRLRRLQRRKKFISISQTLTSDVLLGSIFFTKWIVHTRLPRMVVRHEKGQHVPQCEFVSKYCNFG